MFSMQTTAGENEPVPPEDQRVSLNKIIWWAVGLIYLWLIASTLYVYWREDESFRLTLMHKTIRLLQSIARISGELALDLEQGYNEYIQLLH